MGPGMQASSFFCFGFLVFFGFFWFWLNSSKFTCRWGGLKRAKPDKAQSAHVGSSRAHIIEME